MAKSLTVKGYTFEYPENRDNPGWGEESAAWAEAVTNALQEVSGIGDIAQSIATIDNASSEKAVIGFFIDPAKVIGAVCEYSIYRKTNAEERVEVGQLLVTKKTIGFDLVQVSGGKSGVTLTIDSSGQIKYTSDSMSPDTGYDAYIKFRARALTKR